jgi:hypothetical protein
MAASWRLADAPLLRLNVQLPTIDTNNRIIAFGETYLTANRPTWLSQEGEIYGQSCC